MVDCEGSTFDAQRRDTLIDCVEGIFWLQGELGSKLAHKADCTYLDKFSAVDGKPKIIRKRSLSRDIPGRECGEGERVSVSHGWRRLK